jgi:hypothetical protein
MSRVSDLQDAFTDLTIELFGDLEAALLVFYDKKAWAGQGDNVGENADLSVVTDDTSWYPNLTGYTLDVEEASKTKAALDALGRKHNFEWDLGHEWTLHFWQKG